MPRKTTLTALLVLAALQLPGCGDGKVPNGPSPSETVYVGPNATALAWVEACRENDAARLAKLSTVPLSEFYESVDKIAVKMAEVVSYMREAYPVEAASSHTLLSLSRQWEKVISFLKNLELEGRVREEGPSKVVFRIAYDDKNDIRVRHELVVVRVGRDWKVQSFGDDTYEGVVIGWAKTEAHKIGIYADTALGVVKKKEPRLLDQALILFNDTLTKLASPAKDGGGP